MDPRTVEFQRRTKRFALELIRLVDDLPKTRAGDVIGRQLLRSGTSVAANYRAACRARSGAEFVSRMGIVEEEADESKFWLEMLDEARLAAGECLNPLADEADQLVAIVVASRKTAKQNLARG